MNTTDPLNETEFRKTPTNFQIQNADRIMQTAIKTGLLSRAGYDWLKLATDPWHDNKVNNFKGIPDTNLGNSVTMSVTQEFNISKPASIPAGVWNVRIATYPVASPLGLSSGRLYSNAFTKDASAASCNIAPVCIDYSPGNTDFGDFPSGDSLAIPREYLKGPYKVAGMGIEVVNTTAEIYQQGLASCAVMNQSDDSFFTGAIYSTSSLWDPATLQPVRTVPKNLAELILLPNPTQWHAKEGHYSVVQLTSLDRVGNSTAPFYPIMLSSDLDAEVASASNYKDAFAPTLQPILTQIGSTVYVPYKSPGRVPMNSHVAMYTGLSDQSTLTLRVRWIIERFPNDQEPEILVLATPSAAYDPIALQIYSRLMRNLPSAVMFKENDSTEFWKSVLVNLADIVSSGLLMVPHPLAKAAGGAIQVGRRILAPDVNEAKIKISKQTPKQKAEKRVANAKAKKPPAKK